MEKLVTADIINIIAKMTKVIEENEVAFCELDSVAGDGDFGMSLAKGFRIIREQWEQLPKEDDIGSFLKECGMLITEHCGGATGPIWGSAFRSAAKCTAGKTELNLSEFAEMMQCAVDGIQKRGGAKLGDKTLLDALIPSVEALKKGAESGESIAAAMRESAKEAVAGAEKTKLIVASKGRASYLGERSINHPDAGAVAIGVIFTAIADMWG